MTISDIYEVKGELLIKVLILCQGPCQAGEVCKDEGVFKGPILFSDFFFAEINNPKSLYLKKAAYLALCLQPLHKNPLLWLCQPANTDALSDLSTHLEEDKNQMAAPGRERYHCPF